MQDTVEDLKHKTLVLLSMGWCNLNAIKKALKADDSDWDEVLEWIKYNVVIPTVH